MAFIDIPLQRTMAGVPPMVRLLVDKNHEWKTSSVDVRCGGWTLLAAKPVTYLRWIGTARFSDGSTGFIPDGGRLAALSACLQTNPMQSRLSVPLLLNDGVTTQFVDGRHRAHWLAGRNAAFLPLLVPTQQADAFTNLLDAARV